MREHLLGYLLGALDEDEHVEVSQRLEQDPQLRKQLERLESRLESLGPPDDFEQPPVGLAERTCHFVASQKVELPALPREAPPGNSMGRWNWSIADVSVAAAVFAAAALLFFPAILNSQYQSELAFCQNNLRQLAQALSHYTDTSEGYFPPVSTEGNRGVAGIYGPTLVNNGMLAEPGVLVCPSSELARQGRFEVPTFKEIDGLSGEPLRRAQERMGGSYGYNLGYLEDGRYRVPRHVGRSNFAIMADAPSEFLLGNRISSNHGGRGQNVLFDDWHIEHVSDCKSRDCGDAFYVNRQGVVAAGLDSNDAVIGRSGDSPLLRTLQYGQ
ncbi:MAG: hypothetical protein RIC55_34660 [Pirellulaceae bacterium]